LCEIILGFSLLLNNFRLIFEFEFIELNDGFWGLLICVIFFVDLV